jgi:peptidylprolyl isomerase
MGPVMSNATPTARTGRTALLARLIAALLAFALIAGACGGDDDDAVSVGTDDGVSESGDTDDGAASDDATGDDSSAGDDEAAEPTAVPTPTPAPETDNTDLTLKPLIVVPDLPVPDELQITDVVVGTGEEAAADDFLIMQYVGVSYSNGLQFDASWDRGQPFSFTLGAGNVIKGWDDGIAGMAVGGRRQLVIPPEQAYGENGSGSGSIGPDETLIFMVDLLGVVPAELEKPDVEVPAEPATELVINDLVEGEGEVAEAESVVWVHYVGVGQSTGEQFDASWDRGRDQAIPFVLGVGQVIAGWDQGIEGMKVGGRREIIIPADLAYGEAGAGDGVIAPNETLVFVVDLIAVS